MSTIAELNDDFGSGVTPGRVVITPGIASLPDTERASIIAKVMAFDTFTEANDPHGEHDSGSFDFGDQTIFWKIDYYDPWLTRRSPNPANPAVTRRVLTVMLAEEY